MNENPEPDSVHSWLRQIKHNPHLLGRLIGYNKLIPLHSKWITGCWDTPGSHGLMAFRGSYKTSAVVVTGIIRYLLFNPSTRILIVRKTHAEACQVVKAVSRAFEKQELRALFAITHGVSPEKTEDTKDRLLFNFKQTATIEPSLIAKGIKDAITGAHVDVIIADDIIGLQDKISRAERESVKENIRELSGNILDPGATVIWLGTKWAKGDGWDVIEDFTKVEKYPASQFNTFIPPEELEEKRRRLSPFLYAINYELELIADEGLIFQDPRFGHFDADTWKTEKVVAHIDAAYGGGDTCALTIMSRTHATGWVFDGNICDWYGFITRQYNKYHCAEIIMESNADKGIVAKELRENGLRCRTYHERMNKQIKISSYLYRAWHDIIWDEQTDPEYMNQILDWKADTTGYDDAPDSAASLLREGFAETTALDNSAKAFFYGN